MGKPLLRDVTQRLYLEVEPERSLYLLYFGVRDGSAPAGARCGVVIDRADLVSQSRFPKLRRPLDWCRRDAVPGAAPCRDLPDRERNLLILLGVVARYLGRHRTK